MTESTLRMQPSGLWAICGGDQAPVELETGMLFRLADGTGRLQVRRMEYSAAAAASPTCRWWKGPGQRSA
jgi:hypothetical protein